MTIFGIMYRNKNAEILQDESSALEKKPKYKRLSLITDKKRLKVALAVLEAVKNRFPETKQFIDNTMEDESKGKDIC